MTKCPGCSGSRSNRNAHRKADLREPLLDVADQPAFAAEQMRHSGDVEPEAIAVDLDHRRPALRPAREPLDKGAIAGWIGGHCDQCRVERPSVRQPCAGPRATLGGGFGRRVDDRAVRALEGENDGLVRR